jgi:hypothetical protein
MVPEHLISLPVVPGIAEYSARVREEILSRAGSDFIIAVDLPQGYEKLVMDAAKSLPEISMILDELGRGIPVIPTSGQIEAVRSYLEHGLDLRFIAPGFPVIGNIDDYRYFASLCTEHGIRKVLEDPDKFGIQPGDIIGSWKDMMRRDTPELRFRHVAGEPLSLQIPPYLPDSVSAYRKTRLRFMAREVDQLLSGGHDVLLVHDWRDSSGIIHHLGEEGAAGDFGAGPSTRCLKICEEDVPLLTPEIPYIMYLYEVFRDSGVDREDWIRSICCGTGYPLPASAAKRVLRYCRALAVTDGEAYPDMYNLVAAAKYAFNDLYAFGVYDLARSYPPARNTSPDARIGRTIGFDHREIESSRSLVLIPPLLAVEIPPINERIVRDRRRTRWYSRWTRSDDSYHAEREFIAYVGTRYTALGQSDEDFTAHEYRCGLCEGFDIRETIRNRATGMPYVREKALVNTAAYVLDYRPVNGQLGGERFFSHVFLDKYYAWIGFACSRGYHYDAGIMVGFSGLGFSPTLIFDRLDRSNPLASSVGTALKYAKNVFVFTDAPQEIVCRQRDLSRLKVLPFGTLPRHVSEKMMSFDIVGYRHDDRPGD